jgi:hypothetical protein
MVFSFPDRTGFCGSAPAGRYVYRFVHAKSFLSPAGLRELASFFLTELYTFCAAGASQMPNPQNPVQSAGFSFQLPIETAQLKLKTENYFLRSSTCRVATP